MKKDTYILIVIGVTIILGIGILIGLNINNKLDNKPVESSKTLSNNIDNNDVKDEETIKEESNVVTKEEPVLETNNTQEGVITQDNSNISTNTNNITAPVVTEPVYSTKDTLVINSLEDTLNTINCSKVDSSFKDSAKATFISIVDFLFYDGTIKGITFDELTDNGKAKVLELANKIDTTIESKVPNYKESISSTATKAYKNASALIKKGSTNLNSFLQSKLSEDDYNSIINSKDDLVYYTKNAVSFLKDTGSKLFSNAKTSLSEWYSKYKNS
ncbi:MAG: hypothetical protein IJ565_03400 [Bacilli bacterium]|nr:hypothetical protein [Bacilli bacterium]